MAFVGGGGTYHHALQAKPSVPVAFTPAGRGNDFLRGLLGRVPKPREAFRALEAGRVRSLDLGEIGFEGRHPVFLNGAGLGLDARVAARVDGLPVRGMLPYAVALGQELGNLKPLGLKIRGLFEGEALLAGFGVDKLFPALTQRTGYWTHTR